MDDRTLLERAAKAAGIELRRWNNAYAGYETAQGIWNPLLDDGDALRLGIELGFAIRYPANIEACVSIRGVIMIEAFLPRHDKYAATRRAIVRAAAALAKD